MNKSIKFEDSLEKTDFGFIVCGLTGKLKGLWIPEGMEEKPVPLTIKQICTEYFGVDYSEFDDEKDSGKILH